MTELATNAAKHAYDSRTGVIRIRLAREPQGWRLTVADDGPGLPDDVFERGRLGAKILRVLVGQLHGSLVREEPAWGAAISVTFD